MRVGRRWRRGWRCLKRVPLGKEGESYFDGVTLGKRERRERREWGIWNGGIGVPFSSIRVE